MGAEDEVVLSDDDGRLSENQVMAIVIVPKIASALSMAGSFYIIWQVLGSAEHRTRKLSRMYHRLVLCMSFSDLISSFGIFLGLWPAPAENLNDGDLFGNMGNTATCDAQGFAVNFGSACTWCYNTVLTVYFILFVKYSWNENRLRKIEPLFHAFAVLLPFGDSIFNLVMGWYNTGLPCCYLVAYPWRCTTDSNKECIRGENAASGLFAVAIGAAFNVVVIITCLVHLIMHVKRVEERASMYGPSRNLSQTRRTRNHRQLRKSKKVLTVACWYIGAYVMIFAAFVVIGLSENGDRFLSIVIGSIFLSSQGTVNAIVYSNFQAVNIIKSIIDGIRGSMMWPFCRNAFRTGHSSLQVASGSSNGPCSNSSCKVAAVHDQNSVLSNVDSASDLGVELSMLQPQLRQSLSFDKETTPQDANIQPIEEKSNQADESFDGLFDKDF
mmetsp:Transcript_20798/g.31759  ORF Transcript_20798/g.31759 Transcript_20798/m.31759 type:complete len:440 (-) Transcript_20798:1399-2718(-)